MWKIILGYFSNNVEDHPCLLHKLIQDLDIWTLEPLDVAVMVSHHLPAIGVVSQPGKIDKRSKDTLKIDVVAIMSHMPNINWNNKAKNMPTIQGSIRPRMSLLMPHMRSKETTIMASMYRITNWPAGCISPLRSVSKRGR